MGEPSELTCVGFGYKNAPVAVREALAVIGAAPVLEALRKEGFQEAVVLSTCNRFELYVASGLSSVVLTVVARLAGTDVTEHAAVFSGPSAVLHLFEVAAGLDSLVVGETEILGQVKIAYEAAAAAGMTGKRFNVLFQRALFIGKKVRNDTGIAVGQTSVASVAVQLAESIFGDLKACEVLILGAGNMAEVTARHLLSKKVARLSIANRTWERAQALATRFKGRPLAWADFPEQLAAADVVISSTGSDLPVLTRDMVEAAVSRRAGRSLFIIDIAMPRDVEESVHGLDHVYVYRLGDLEAIVADNLKHRGGEVERARALATLKAREFSAWTASVASGREVSLKHSEART